MGNNNFVVYKAEFSSGAYFYLPLPKDTFNTLYKASTIIKRTIVRDKLTHKEAVDFCEVICKLKGI